MLVGPPAGPSARLFLKAVRHGCGTPKKPDRKQFEEETSPFRTKGAPRPKGFVMAVQQCVHDF